MMDENDKCCEFCKFEDVDASEPPCSSCLHNCGSGYINNFENKEICEFCCFEGADPYQLPCSICKNGIHIGNVNNEFKPREAVIKTLNGKVMGIAQTLKERGENYGEFKELARVTQNLKETMQDSPNWSSMRCDQKEALEMVQHKIGRILNGNPDLHDSWHDCVGYMKLVADTLTPVDEVKT